ncbi:MCE family protein [Allokutzneria albata]|uniref:Phospholipid/cholesterol/gamma-HCH transport system substrate-binding protein n=1 Tax=Allokutzneria albata TaxID=211114 RepID=A0A1G9Z0X1_ALLAB|nr:MCE family protein [Allokutzneria albata]SDN14625.1 phospholipid/cholesterol/gamma-HCH transport system substrate-binding protein [Allokutzneria albata]
MKPFRERNPVTVGASGLLVLLLGLLAAFFAEDLPIVGGGTSYRAHFSEAGGLRDGDEVRVAGVKVGKVTGVELEDDHVLVSFRVSDTWVGDRTSAAIKIKTLLGQKFLSLDPQGEQELRPSQVIPRERTIAPYDVTEAFTGLATTLTEIDTDQLAKSFRVISDTFRDTPGEVRGALDGLSALSRTISTRDQQLAALLRNTNQLSKTVSDRNAEFEKLLGDGNKLLEEIRKRRDAIRNLLTGTRTLSKELQGLVVDNKAQLRPALEQLERVTTMLDRNQESLSKSIQLMAPFVRVFANTLGNGRWFDTYICGLLPPSIGPINPEGCRP